MAGRILIAEDIATTRIKLRVQLANARYDVAAVDSRAGLETALKRAQPDLLILSDTFDGAEGTEICRGLRTEKSTAHLPILLLLEEATAERRLTGLIAGANDMVTRHVSEFSLMSRVRALLRARVTHAETVRRHETAASFGFAEGPALFEQQARITLIPAGRDTESLWSESLPGLLNASVSVMDPNMALDLADGPQSPDAFVVDADIPRPGGGLALLSDLRSRDGTRHAAIIFAYRDEEADIGATALDLGANDLVPLSAAPEELALRLKTQVRRKQEADALRRTVEDGLRLAATDALTGLYNRRYAMAYLDRTAEESARTGKPFTVMVADLDHFKRINDTYGHGAGDDVLRGVAQTLRDCLRGEDLVARLGGEEFLIVMPATDLERARPVAERLLRTVAQSPVAAAGCPTPISVTMSLGGAVGGLTTLAPLDVDALVAEADAALYQAKADGRNTVSIAKVAA